MLIKVTLKVCLWQRASGFCPHIPLSDSFINYLNGMKIRKPANQVCGVTESWESHLKQMQTHTKSNRLGVIEYT